MLQSIRDRTQGWIAGIIISILILSFALWGIHSYMVASGSDTNVATVNGINITKNQSNAAYERLRRQIQSQFNNIDMTPDIDHSLKAKALQTLIESHVLEDGATHLGYRIGSRQITDVLSDLPEFQVNGQFSAVKFQQALSNSLYSPTEFINLIKTTLLVDQPKLGIILTSFSMPEEVEEAINLINQERNIRYLPFSLKELQKPVAVTLDQVKAYYDSHHDEFKSPEKVSIQYVEMSLANFMVVSQINDQILQKFYEENASNFMEAAQWKIEALLIPLSNNPTSQAIELAQTKADEIYKKLMNTKAVGGSLMQLGKTLKVNSMPGVQPDVWLTLNQLPQVLQSKMGEMNEAGKVYSPFHTPYGFVIVKIIDFKKPTVSAFATIKDKVRTSYVKQQAEQQFSDARDQLGSLAYEHPESLDSVIKALHLTVKTTGLFAKDETGAGILANPKIREAAYSNDVLNSQNNSDVIPIDPNSVVVLRINQHTPAFLIPFETIQSQIKDKLQGEAMANYARQTVEAYQKKLMSGLSADKLAQETHTAWTNVGFIGRHSTKVDAAILNTAFTMPISSDNKVSSYAVVKIPNGFAIVNLLAIKKGVLLNNGEYNAYAEQTQNSQGLLEYELYKQNLLSQAKIEIAQ